MAKKQTPRRVDPPPAPEFAGGPPKVLGLPDGAHVVWVNPSLEAEGGVDHYVSKGYEFVRRGGDVVVLSKSTGLGDSSETVQWRKQVAMWCTAEAKAAEYAQGQARVSQVERQYIRRTNGLDKLRGIGGGGGEYVTDYDHTSGELVERS